MADDYKPILSFQWHITTRCDQRCQHCYLFQGSDETKQEIAGEKNIKSAELKGIADNIVASCERLEAEPYFILTGGDPILHEHFWDLLEYIKEVSGNGVMILGNPFHVTDDVAQRMKELEVDRYQVSLDGMRDFHDAMRKPGSFDATIEAIQILNRNKIESVVMSTVSKLNAGELPDLARYVADLKVSSYAFARYCPTKNGIDASETFAPLEYRDFLESMWNVYSELMESETRFSLKDHLWALFLKEIGVFAPEDTDGVVVGGCGLGISHMTILADGTVYGCRRFTSPVGNALVQDLDRVFLGRELEIYRDYSKKEKCRDCDLLNYCRGCIAVSACATGDWNSADPQCWM
ncbi:radical SAM protein [Patescibacteria group bacterium]